MGSINFTVVSRIESLAVASLFEANSGATAGVLSTCAIIFVDLFAASLCEWNYIGASLSNCVECVSLSFSAGLSGSLLWCVYFRLVLALWASPDHVISVNGVDTLAELIELSVNIHLFKVSAIFAIECIHLTENSRLLNEQLGEALFTKLTAAI